MSGVTSGVGLFSGIDRNSIIAQLLALEARPRTQAQARMVQFQAINAAYLDLSSRMQAIKSAANTIRTKNVFGSAGATSSGRSSGGSLRRGSGMTPRWARSPSCGG